MIKYKFIPWIQIVAYRRVLLHNASITIYWILHQGFSNFVPASGSPEGAQGSCETPSFSDFLGLERGPSLHFCQVPSWRRCSPHSENLGTEHYKCVIMTHSRTTAQDVWYRYNTHRINTLLQKPTINEKQNKNKKKQTKIYCHIPSYVIW